MSICCSLMVSVAISLDAAFFLIVSRHPIDTMDSLRQVDVQIKMNPEIIVPVLILGEIQLLILYLGKRNGLFLISFAEISHILDNNTGFRKKILICIKKLQANLN